MVAGTRRESSRGVASYSYFGPYTYSTNAIQPMAGTFGGTCDYQKLTDRYLGRGGFKYSVGTPQVDQLTLLQQRGAVLCTE